MQSNLSVWSHTDWTALNRAGSRLMLWSVQNQSHVTPNLELFIFFSTVMAFPFLPYSHPKLLTLKHFFPVLTLFSFLFCCALWISLHYCSDSFRTTTVQSYFTGKKNNSTCRILLLNWNLSEGRFQTIYFQGFFFSNFRTVQC